jgi:ribose 5-phosphate isomerase A
LKKLAAVRAAEWIRDGMTLGLGTGSTIRHLLDEIASRRSRGQWKNVISVPTSDDTAARAQALGIPLTSLDRHPELDLTIDGADEIDPSLDLIKGLGGALLREKITAAASAVLVIVADESKIVGRLGTRAPLPVEVERFGAAIHMDFFRSLGADPALRLGTAGDPLLTDGGHLIYDCRFRDGIADADALSTTLSTRPGIIESGLFLGMADHAVVAGAGGVRVLSRRG